MTRELSVYDKMNREHLLKSYTHLGGEFTTFVLQHYDLKIDPDMFNYSAVCVEIAKDFYNHWHKYVDNIVVKYGKTSSEAIACSNILVSSCILGINTFCQHIVSTRSNKELSNFLNKTNGIYHLDLCKRLCLCLRDDFLLNDDITAIYNSHSYTFTRAQGKIVELTTKSSSDKKEGCYIATMVYGRYDASEVIRLRWYRDTVLQKSHSGRALVKLYYLVSPFIISYLGKYSLFHKVSKQIIEYTFKSILN